MTANWVDETAYRKGEKGVVPARTWRLDVGNLGLTVTRHPSYPDDAWLLRSDVTGQVQLDSTDVREAKHEAIRLVHTKLENMAADVRKVLSQESSTRAATEGGARD